MRAVCFFRLSAPFVADRRAVWLQRQRAGDFAGGSLGRFYLRDALGEPAAAGRRDFKILVPDGLPAEFDGEFALVLSEDNRARRRGLFLSRERKRRARRDPKCQRNRYGSEFHSASYPRVHSLSGKRFLHQQMRGVSTGSNNAATQNFGDNLSRFAGAVHAVISKLIRGKTLGVERAEAAFIAEERTAGHGHAARKKNFDGRIQPQHGKDRKSTRLNSSHLVISYAVFCLKKKNNEGPHFDGIDHTKRTKRIA